MYQQLKHRSAVYQQKTHFEMGRWRLLSELEEDTGLHKEAKVAQGVDYTWLSQEGEGDKRQHREEVQAVAMKLELLCSFQGVQLQLVHLQHNVVKDKHQSVEWEGMEAQLEQEGLEAQWAEEVYQPLSQQLSSHLNDGHSC